MVLMIHYHTILNQNITKNPYNWKRSIDHVHLASKRVNLVLSYSVQVNFLI